MPRPPDLEAKTSQLIFKSKNKEEEILLKAFKEICIRNKKRYRDELIRLIRDTFLLREHNWPPGNSQTVLDVFDGGLKDLRGPVCFDVNCNRKATSLLWLVGGGKLPACPIHRENELRKVNRVKGERKL